MTNRMIDDLYNHMPWDQVDTVVFDVGGILISMDPEDILETLYPDAKPLYETLIRKMIRTPYWNMLDGGTLTLHEAIEAMVGKDKELQPYIHGFMTRWPEFNYTIAEGIEALVECKKQGKKTLILSNYPDEHFAANERRFDFLKLFDGMVISAREHLLKPKPAIYRLLIDRYGLDTSRTMFIDDTPANVEAAITEGWYGFCHNMPGKLASFILPVKSGAETPPSI